MMSTHHKQIGKFHGFHYPEMSTLPMLLDKQ